MSIDQINIAPEPSVEAPKATRRENLALSYQEILTVTTRLRASRQAVMDAETFRSSMKAALSAAEADAVRKGYTPDDARLASFAVVAFLDESVAVVSDPNFADWSRRPLQEEMYGEHTSGEVFFQRIDRLLARGNSPQDADALEVFGLCLLLGYRGRYAASGQGGVETVVTAIADKVQRIRGPRPLAPAASGSLGAGASDGNFGSFVPRGLVFCGL